MPDLLFQRPDARHRLRRTPGGATSTTPRAQARPRVSVFWTGKGDLRACRQRRPHGCAWPRSLRRKPTLWDNYPVSDGPNRCRASCICAVSPGRPGAIAPCVAGMPINPALQLAH
ncbi:MAG: beta-N-acetylglucosaminidase domain-containing protein [Betaproteobacteria bacterium]|nr:beta-N-acetylglucosaminidase domain-containing protein [Betaproteobacteria bacterium]